METIFALSTPRAKSALAIIRLSGEKAHAIGEKITQTKLAINKPKLCWLYQQFDKNEKKERTSRAFDHALVHYSKAPNSFTGEDTVEFSIHGSLIIIEKLEQSLKNLGARYAYPGEFTEQAFLNGKIDLTKAEAICDLIDAQNESALFASINSLKGVFSKKVQRFVDDLIAIRVEIEAEIDFIDEGIEFKSQKQLHQKLRDIYQNITKDITEAKSYQKMAKGIQVALIGAPNAGKSSLMNALLNNQRAIVSDEAGTTRDSLIENFNLGNLEIKLIDTAGIRKSDSKAENLSIERTYEAIYQADILLIVDDINQPIDETQMKLIGIKEIKNKQIIWIHNKLDLLREKNGAEKNRAMNETKEINPLCKKMNAKPLFVSALTGENLNLIKEQLEKINTTEDLTENQYLARDRQIFALENARENLKLALDEIEKEEGLIDLLAEQLRYTHQALEEILGVYTSDELLGEIFSNFCIGK